MAEITDKETSPPIPERFNREVQLAFSGLDFRYVEMKEPNWVAFEALASGLVSLYVSVRRS